MIIISNSEADTVEAGKYLGASVEPGSVIALYGELGAGKTAFIRGVAEGLDIDTRVVSPTFTIVNEYLGTVPLFHFDMYRLGSENELFDIGWDDYLERGGVCAVEWSENVEKAFSPDTIRVKIDKIGPSSRKIEITIPEQES